MGCLKISYYADVVSYSNYEAFNFVASFGGGMLLLGRHPSVDGQVGNADTYNRGFNGMLKDDEIKNVEGSSYDFGARMYDSRLGRWFKTDGREKEYSCFSPYNFGLNNPVYYVDKDGNVIWDPANKEAVVVTYDENGKPSFKLEGGGEVSDEFQRQAITPFLAVMAESNIGQALISEMINSPTKIIVTMRKGKDNREKSSGIDPKEKNNGEPKLKNGLFKEVTIRPNKKAIIKNCRKNHISYAEMLLGVMAVEIGHLSNSNQIENDQKLLKAGYGYIVSENAIIENNIVIESGGLEEVKNKEKYLQQCAKDAYENLFAKAAMVQYSYRIEKNIPINNGILSIGVGAKKRDNVVFKSTNIMTTGEVKMFHQLLISFIK